MNRMERRHSYDNISDENLIKEGHSMTSPLTNTSRPKKLKTDCDDPALRTRNRSKTRRRDMGWWRDGFPLEGEVEEHPDGVLSSQSVSDNRRKKKFGEENRTDPHTGHQLVQQSEAEGKDITAKKESALIQTSRRSEEPVVSVRALKGQECKGTFGVACVVWRSIDGSWNSRHFKLLYLICASSVRGMHHTTVICIIFFFLIVKNTLWLVAVKLQKRVN